MALTVRIATPDDHDAVGRILVDSYSKLMPAGYEPAQLARVLPVIVRPHPGLLASGSYYLAEVDGVPAGCGGWSRQRPGSDQTEPGLAHIRHFAVCAGWTGRGVGRALYARCETDARAAGADRFEVQSSLNGEAFYARLHGLLDAAGLRVEGIGIPDTVGVSTIDEVGDRIAVLRRVGIAFDFLESHIHNDIGNADRMYVDTLLLCQRLGITMLPDFSILGIGERNGTIGLSSLLEAIYRRLILLYPRKMPEIRAAMRGRLGALPSGELFVNRYRDMDTFFYHLLSSTGFVFDRSPFSANTEFDGSGVHADTTMRAYLLAQSENIAGQAAIDLGNSAYCGALPPYDMPLRTPALACFGCGKANVRYWREREQLALRAPDDIRAQAAHLEELDPSALAQPINEGQADEMVAQLIRRLSVKMNGIRHQEAIELMMLFYCKI